MFRVTCIFMKKTEMKVKADKAMDITEEQYKFAQQRIEELLPEVDEDMPLGNPKYVELLKVSKIVMEYEEEHYPIGTPTVAGLIDDGLYETKMTKEQLAEELDISIECVNDYLSGKAEPSLRVAGQICRKLNIRPEEILML